MTALTAAQSAVSTILRRGLLYVPASSSRFLQKSHSLKVDTVAYDLEDSVTPSRKADARKELRQFLEQGRPPTVREVAVRINSVDSGFAEDDLKEVLKAPHIDAIVVPKVNSASDLHFIADIIRHILPSRHPSSTSATSTSSEENVADDPASKPLHILALIESARSVISLPQICTSTPLLNGLIFAAEDYSHDLSLTRSPSLLEMLYARQSIVTHARAFNIPSVIDLVCTAYGTVDGAVHGNHRGPRGNKDDGTRRLRKECNDGKDMGFNGKQLIHPSQIPMAQEIFGIGSPATVEWAVRVLIANEKAMQQGRGAWTMDGKMVDEPVIKKARAVVERAQLCEFPVAELEQRLEGVEPE